MSTIRTSVARITAASVLVFGLGALGASPALASYSSWAGAVPPEAAPELVRSEGDATIIVTSWVG